MRATRSGLGRRHPPRVCCTTRHGHPGDALTGQLGGSRGRVRPRGRVMSRVRIRGRVGPRVRAGVSVKARAGVRGRVRVRVWATKG